jgi:transposase-like protein
MATSLAHAHRVPHTVKQPARCPHCGSTRLIRKGTRRKKLEIMQLWQCKLCRRVFTPAPPSLRYKTYPLRVILDGVTLYNLGYSLPVAAQKLKAKHGYKIPPSTLASWMAEQKFFWKCNYYDKEMEFGSEDPSNPERTTRVATLMLASDY